MKNILNKILEAHHDDIEQQEVIKTDKNRLIIEAPAGYGKTRTMISQIAYLIASYKLPNPKKILALTFSVNAAYKIRKDIASSVFEGLPPHSLKDKVFATNYHGFCRRILSLYGYLIDENLRNIENLISIDDSNSESLNRDQGLDLEIAYFLSDFNAAVKQLDYKFIKENFLNYNEIVRKTLLNNNFITFNSILTLTIELFLSRPDLKTFYQRLYPIIIVDEFQDTNILSWYLLNCLVSDKTKLYLYGDSLQRIYGFIGAIPNLLKKSQKKFKADKIELKINYRFKNNKEMLLLDKNIREIAKDINSNPKQKASLLFYLTENQDEEAELICNLCREILNTHNDKRIAILVRQRGKNIDRIIEEFKNKQIDFFYALFSDEDKEYVEFHKIVLKNFLNLLKTNKMKRDLLKDLIKDLIEQEKQKLMNDVKKALIELFKTYWNEVLFGEYNFLGTSEKVDFIKDTLENYGLKQYLGYTKHRITITTVHGAKGLEWDFVILPDMEQYSFPNWLGLCGSCKKLTNCEISYWELAKNNDFYNELSIFYVAVTRAKIKNIFTASKHRIDNEGNLKTVNISCLLKLPGLEINTMKLQELHKLKDLLI